MILPGYAKLPPPPRLIVKQLRIIIFTYYQQMPFNSTCAVSAMHLTQLRGLKIHFKGNRGNNLQYIHVVVLRGYAKLPPLGSLLNNCLLSLSLIINKCRATAHAMLSDMEI